MHWSRLKWFWATWSYLLCMLTIMCWVSRPNTSSRHQIWINGGLADSLALALCESHVWRKDSHILTLKSVYALDSAHEAEKSLLWWFHIWEYHALVCQIHHASIINCANYRYACCILSSLLPSSLLLFVYKPFIFFFHPFCSSKVLLYKFIDTYISVVIAEGWQGQ